MEEHKDVDCKGDRCGDVKVIVVVMVMRTMMAHHVMKKTLLQFSPRARSVSPISPVNR